MKKAIYPLSADPITNGHLDIIERASKIFDELIVAVGISSDKNYLFSLEERKQITKKVLEKFSNVRVISFEGLLTDLAKKLDIYLIVRGFRNSNDYLHELNLYQNYLSQNKNLEFINLFSSNNFISSSSVKELIKLNGEIHKSVPILVKFELEKKLNSQILIGVTGQMGSGKSYVTSGLVSELIGLGFDCCKIDLDLIAKEIYNSTEEESLIVKKKIMDTFGSEVIKNSKIDRKLLAQKVFKNPKSLELLNQITHPLILLKVREKLQKLKGIVFLESALFAEENLAYLINNHILLVDSEEEIRNKRLAKKGFSVEEIELRKKSQFSFQQKYQTIVDLIKKDGFGKIWTIENNQKPNITFLAKTIADYFAE